MTMEHVRIVLADPQFLTCKGLEALFASVGNLEVVSTVQDADELWEALVTHKPTLVVMDYHRGEHFQLEQIRTLKRDFPRTKILLVTDDDRKDNIFKALENGVSGILTKNCGREEIINAVQTTARGEKFFCNKVLDALLENHIRQDQAEEDDCAPTVLSKRELEVVELVAEGIPTKIIADKLCLSPHTVYTHRKNIMKKLGVSSATELVMFAVNKGLVKVGG